MNHESSKAIVLQFWALMQSNDFRAASHLLTDDYVLDWPLTNERIRGRDRFVAINEMYPANGVWRFTINHCVAESDTVVTDVTVTDGVQRAQALTFSTVRDGKIARQVEYWPEPYDPPAWRRQYVEQIQKK